jgi:hypothetical protein
MFIFFQAPGNTEHQGGNRIYTQTKKNWEVFIADFKTWEIYITPTTSPFMEMKLEGCGKMAWPFMLMISPERNPSGNLIFNMWATDEMQIWQDMPWHPATAHHVEVILVYDNGVGEFFTEVVSQ